MDSYRSFLVLRFPPSKIAIGAFFLAFVFKCQKPNGKLFQNGQAGKYKLEKMRGEKKRVKVAPKDKGDKGAAAAAAKGAAELVRLSLLSTGLCLEGN